MPAGAGPIGSWDEAAAYARSTNAVAFPDFGDGDWLAFARRLFREDGRPRSSRLRSGHRRGLAGRQPG